MKLTRTFISLDFPKDIIKEISKVQLLLPNFKGKLIQPENLHLTLKFLGEIPEETLFKTSTLLSKIQFKPLNLSLSNTGTFNHNNKPRIAWIKIIGADKIQKLIDLFLQNLFPKEQRFMSHLTIARIKHAKNPQQLISQIHNIKPSPLKFQTNEINLKSSNLTPKGPEYKTLLTIQS